MNISNQIIVSRHTTAAYYDEQFLLGFANNTATLAYNVTAIAQNDSNGFGPVYLLNGRTEKNLWYQVGLSWNWVYNYSQTHSQGFNLFYQVWNTTSAKSIFPNPYGSGSIHFTKPVRSGDIVLLSLSLTGEEVNMSARDWESNGTESVSFPDA
jgi:hypothetical protein